MPKITKPTTPATETPAPQAPDISPLLQTLAPFVEGIRDADQTKDNARIDIAVSIREFREENPEVERGAIKLAIQTVIAETYSLKIEHVQSKPEDTLKKSKPADYANRNSCYTLVTELLGIAWAKDEKLDTKVGKLLDAGEKRFTILKRASQKAQNNPNADPNKNKITEENFPAKFNLFITQAMTDMSKTVDEVLEMAEAAVDAMKAAPKE